MRKFLKYPAFSLINLGGLSIGIAASFILLSYAHREFNTDRHFRDAEGLSIAQIAERLGVAVGTVKSRSFRAHRRLATDLGHLREEPRGAARAASGPAR